MKIQRITTSAIKSLKRHSPMILSCLAVAGVVGTAVTAVRATPKALKRIKEAEKNKAEPLSKTEKVATTISCYIPCVVIGIGTMVCIFGAHALNKRQQASLISAYTLLEQSYKEYRSAANNIYGEDADSKIQAEMAKKTYISSGNECLYDPDLSSDDECLFYDFYSKRYFTAKMSAVINAEYHVNRNLALRGEVAVNEFYDFLGIDHVRGGDEFGWNLDGMMTGGLAWLDFNNEYTELDDGLECYIITTPCVGPSLLLPYER